MVPTRFQITNCFIKKYPIYWYYDSSFTIWSHFGPFNLRNNTKQPQRYILNKPRQYFFKMNCQTAGGNTQYLYRVTPGGKYQHFHKKRFQILVYNIHVCQFHNFDRIVVKNVHKNAFSMSSNINCQTSGCNTIQECTLSQIHTF